jgi:hypothetical protein
MAAAVKAALGMKGTPSPRSRHRARMAAKVDGRRRLSRRRIGGGWRATTDDDEHYVYAVAL